MKLKSAIMPVMLLDVKETPLSYEIDVEVPGVENKNVNINLRGNSLIIEAHRETMKKNDNDLFHRVERTSGHASRLLTLPSNANLDEIDAVNKNGVLHIKIKKTDTKDFKERRVEIKNDP
jgi:HSP20 family protein